MYASPALALVHWIVLTDADVMRALDSAVYFINPRSSLPANHYDFLGSLDMSFVWFPRVIYFASIVSNEIGTEHDPAKQRRDMLKDPTAIKIPDLSRAVC